MGVGELAILGCVGCVGAWTAYTLLGRAVLGTLSPLAAVTGAALVGDLLPSGSTLGEGLLASLPGWSARAWVALVYRTLGDTVVAVVWLYRGVRVLGAARAGVFINLVPGSGVTLAWLVLGERPDVSLVVDGALVAGGVVLTQSGGKGPYDSSDRALTLTSRKLLAFANDEFNNR